MNAIATRYRRFSIAMILVTQCLVAVADVGVGEPVSIPPAQAAGLMAKQEAVLIDVREDSEWRQQHIPNAVHIPLGELAKRLPELERYKTAAIITQCRSGRRSLQAAKTLQAAGFGQVYNLDGGLVAWQKAGLPSQ